METVDFMCGKQGKKILHANSIVSSRSFSSVTNEGKTSCSVSLIFQPICAKQLSGGIVSS